ncbi:MAG: hypothetical protein M3292_02475 [Actinomycetota bacterium]|nr:hypothetical protein [Actinomycetota bacterium]
MADAAKMIFLGFGKYVRADRIYALEPLRGDERGGGRRTRVWVDGIPEPLIASRTERTILLEMGLRGEAATPLVDDALELARRVAEDAEKVGPLLSRSIKAEAGVDFADLGRRARRLLEQTAAAEPADGPKLF